MKRREEKELKWTTNSPLYNKLRKRKLALTGKIRCDYCGYNRGENFTGKWYGTFVDDVNDYNVKDLHHPSWKLASKKKKQYLAKEEKYFEVKTQIYFRRRSYVAVKSKQRRL